MVVARPTRTVCHLAGSHDFRWDNSLEPAPTIDPGEMAIFKCKEAYGANSPPIPLWRHSSLGPWVRQSSLLDRPGVRGLDQHIPGERSPDRGVWRYLAPPNLAGRRRRPGCIGTTPLRPVAAGADSVYGQGPHGGNLDVPDVHMGTAGPPCQVTLGSPAGG
jgi:hypothetical protein